MSRATFDPAEFGVGVSKDEFMDRIADTFNETFRGSLSVDELLLRPREAVRFCDSVRARHNWFDVPDDILLRSLMNRRKNPGA